MAIMAARNQVIDVFNTNALQNQIYVDSNNYLKQLKKCFNKTHTQINQLISAFYTAEKII